MYFTKQYRGLWGRSISKTLTSVFVFSFVHLAVGAFSCDSNDLKLVHAPFAPVDLRFLNLTVSWATNSGNYKNTFKWRIKKTKARENNIFLIVRLHTWVFCEVFGTFYLPVGCAGKTCHQEVQGAEAGRWEVDEPFCQIFSSLSASYPSSWLEKEQQIQTQNSKSLKSGINLHIKF